MRNTFIRCLADYARDDEKVILITADLGYSVLEEFEREFPKRFYNVGIAEQNAVSVAAGLAMSGKTVFVYSIVPFITMRCFEQVRVDLAYQQTNVKLVGVGGGLSYGPAGATHHSIEDIAIMRSLPNMKVVCPGDPHEVEALLPQIARDPGPVYIRLGKNGEPRLHPPGKAIPIGKAVNMRDLGADFAMLTTSNMLEQSIDVVDRLAEKGLRGSLYSVPTVKPLDTELLKTLVEKKLPIFTLEEHSRIGGLGGAVAEAVSGMKTPVRVVRIGLPDAYSHYVGSQTFLRGKLGIDSESVVRLIQEELK